MWVKYFPGDCFSYIFFLSEYCFCSSIWTACSKMLSFFNALIHQPTSPAWCSLSFVHEYILFLSYFFIWNFCIPISTILLCTHLPYKNSGFYFYLYSISFYVLLFNLVIVLYYACHYLSSEFTLPVKKTIFYLMELIKEEQNKIVKPQ